MTPLFLPLSDQAVMAYFPTEADALAFASAVQSARDRWVLDIVPAYSSVAVFFDLAQVDFQQASRRLEEVLRAQPRQDQSSGKVHRIPCCYELGLDGPRVAVHTGLAVADIVRLHSATTYTVYAIGFCPGFPYLGYLPDQLAGVPRLDTPRLRVEAGSVGLTGRQTGIYTEARPGGWNIIGRTPLLLVSVVDGYFPLRAGDRVQFFPIDLEQFHELEGKRLEVPSILAKL